MNGRGTDSMGSLRTGGGILLILLLIPALLFSQSDSVDVTFYYTPPVVPDNIYLRGEFNGWSTETPMIYDDEADRYFATVRLRRGGPSPLPAAHSIPGAYQYKFYYTRTGTEYWVQDPLNPRENPFDHNNSYVYINDPTVYQLVPNRVSGLVVTRTPTVRAYLFPGTVSAIDPETIELVVDGRSYTGLGEYYDSESHLFSYQIPDPLTSGAHTLRLSAGTTDGSVSSDSTEFTVEAGFIRLLTRPNDRYLHPEITVDGTVQDSSVTEVILHHNGTPTPVEANNGFFSGIIDLTEGNNTVYAEIDDPDIEDNVSDPITIYYHIDRNPRPLITGSIEENNVMLEIEELNPVWYMYMTGYWWESDDSLNPIPLGIQERGESITFPLPDVPGEYYIDVISERVMIIDTMDPLGLGENGGDEGIWFGTARTFIRVHDDGTAEISSVEKNPSWVRDAIVYEIYIPAFGPNGGGTFQDIIDRLPEIQDLGVNVIWFMPLYDNNESINALNAGYNIYDFYSVHPQLGTMQKFEELVETAHGMEIRIILDSTPNHIGGMHPWLDDLRAYRDYSIYRPMIENRLLGDARDLGQEIVRLDGTYPLYARYSNWTLPNLNYENPETADYMTEMYRWWVLEKNIDGYRMDVYWGPQNRYGKEAWWGPFRKEIKRVKPDVFILSETDGTGFGSENNYADAGGASDAAYDWALYGTIKEILSGSGGGNLNTLHDRVSNFAPPGEAYNYYTGSNSHIFRFVENHDEPRITQLYGTAKAKAGAVLNLTIPGIPMIYAGQEVGETSQRGTINWTRTGATEMREYFRRLTHSRNEFPSFRTGTIRRIQSGHGRVYSYSRPYEGANAIVAVNLSGSTVSATLQITDNALAGTLDDLNTYYLNDLLNDSSATVTKTDLASYGVTLGPWESVVYLLADSLVKLVTTVPGEIDRGLPGTFTLHQNYPNPFNPGTTIRYEIPKATRVILTVYDMLGRRVGTIVDEYQNEGRYQHHFDASHLSSGVYFYRIEAGEFVGVKRMLYIR
jgi:glycosidase